MINLEENWTSRELNIYLNSIREGEREKVLAQVLDQKNLRQYLATDDGKLILKDAINILRSELAEIYKLVLEGTSDNIYKIIACADRYRAAADIMYRWMTLLQKGEVHEKKIKARVKKIK